MSSNGHSVQEWVVLRFAGRDWQRVERAVERAHLTGELVRHYACGGVAAVEWRVRASERERFLAVIAAVS